MLFTPYVYSTDPTYDGGTLIPCPSGAGWPLGQDIFTSVCSPYHIVIDWDGSGDSIDILP